MNGTSSAGGTSGAGTGMHASNQGDAAARSPGTSNSVGDTGGTDHATGAAVSGTVSADTTNTLTNRASEQLTASPLAHFSSESPASMSPHALSTRQQVQTAAASFAAEAATTTTPQSEPTAEDIARLPASFRALSPQAFAAPALFQLQRATPTQPSVSALGPDPKAAPKTSFEPTFGATLTQAFNLDKGSYAASVAHRGLLRAGDSLSLSITANNLGTPLLERAGTERADIKAAYATQVFEANAGVQNFLSPQANAFANIAIGGAAWKVEGGIAYGHSRNLKGTAKAEVSLTDHLKAYASVEKQESAPLRAVAGMKYQFSPNAFIAAEFRKDSNGQASGYIGVGASVKF